jgi:hypothetical protein
MALQDCAPSDQLPSNLEEQISANLAKGDCRQTTDQRWPITEIGSNDAQPQGAKANAGEQSDSYHRKT